VGIAQLAGSLGGNKGSMVVSRLLLHLLNLGHPGGLGGLSLTGGEHSGVKVALVGPGQAPVLAGGLLPGQAGADGALLEGDLGRLGGSIRILGLPGGLGDLDELGGARQVLGDKLLGRKVVINCDASKKLSSVFLKSRGEHNAEGIHLEEDVSSENLMF